MIEPLRDLSKMETDEKVSEMESYLRNLCEHLNWQFQNLSAENFTEEWRSEN